VVLARKVLDCDASSWHTTYKQESNSTWNYQCKIENAGFGINGKHQDNYGTEVGWQKRCHTPQHLPFKWNSHSHQVQWNSTKSQAVYDYDSHNLQLISQIRCYSTNLWWLVIWYRKLAVEVI
jgi:hypothetical protein